jgi:Autographiviridae endonuclease VII
MKKELSNNPSAVRIREWRRAHPEEAKEKSRLAAERRRAKLPEIVATESREQKRRWREANPEAARDYQRRWRERNRERSQQIQREWREKHPAYDKQWRDKNREKVRQTALASYYKHRDKVCAAAGWRNVRRIYGISRDQYYAIVELQGGGCGICGKTQGEHGKRFPLDHCHEIGLVRGVLCEECNLLLGKIEDKKDWVAKMQRYIADPPAAKIIVTHCKKLWKKEWTKQSHERSNPISSEL